MKGKKQREKQLQEDSRFPMVTFCSLRVINKLKIIPIKMLMYANIGFGVLPPPLPQGLCNAQTQ